MKDGDAVGGQDGSDLITHADHIHRVIRRAAGAGGGILLSFGHGVGLAAVGVDDQNLRRVVGECGGEAAVEPGGVQRLGGVVFDKYVTYLHKAGGGGGGDSLGRGAVVGIVLRRIWQGGLRRLLRLLPGRGGLRYGGRVI